MSLPPERISIKRRRHEEPLELFCESLIDAHILANADNRAKLEAEAPTRPKLSQQDTSVDNKRVASSDAASGIPVVRATLPGTEIREEAERRVAQKTLRERYVPKNQTLERAAPELVECQRLLPDDGSFRSKKASKPVRRFHLSRSHATSRPSHTSHYSGIRKPKTARQNYLATFTERFKPSSLGPVLLAQIATKEQERISQKDGSLQSYSGDRSLSQSHSPLRRQMVETGYSIRDHPSTWDHDSDQLAEELAAFAVELSQDEKRDETPMNITENYHKDIKDAITNPAEDWVYDTYVRVPIGTAKDGEKPTDDVGLLVIGDEDQDFWQEFGESDDENGWDQEDPDSNAEENPANEYPDEEIDSEDESGNAYLHHGSAFDDEYDVRDPWSDSEQ